MPVGAGDPADLAAQIQALKRELEALKNTAFRSQRDTTNIENPETWHNLPLAAGWSGSLAYYKDAMGRVFLDTSGGAPLSNASIQNGDLIGTLPPGYRPRAGTSVTFGIPCDCTPGNTGVGQVEIYDDGAIKAYPAVFPDGVSGYVYLSGLSFRTV